MQIQAETGDDLFIARMFVQRGGKKPELEVQSYE
jgi:hypothetical protein